jgi:hypothetical protein
MRMQQKRRRFGDRIRSILPALPTGLSPTPLNPISRTRMRVTLTRGRQHPCSKGPGTTQACTGTAGSPAALQRCHDAIHARFRLHSAVPDGPPIQGDVRAATVAAHLAAALPAAPPAEQPGVEDTVCSTVEGERASNLNAAIQPLAA